MSRVSRPPKKVGETKVYVVDFISQLTPGITVSSCVVTATTFSGSDSNPNGLVSGSATVANTGTAVSQKIAGGVAGVVYEVTYTATCSDTSVLKISFYLAVLS